jgi:hypothetical protein
LAGDAEAQRSEEHPESWRLPALPLGSREHDPRFVQLETAGKAELNLSAAMDRVHQRFGRKALTVSFEPAELGTKIAFTRVPDVSECDE